MKNKGKLSFSLLFSMYNENAQRGEHKRQRVIQYAIDYKEKNNKTKWHIRKKQILRCTQSSEIVGWRLPPSKRTRLKCLSARGRGKMARALLLLTTHNAELPRPYPA
jgi:hypothetical protein